MSQNTFRNVLCMSDWSPVLNGFEEETLIPQSSSHLVFRVFFMQFFPL